MIIILIRRNAEEEAMDILKDNMIEIPEDELKKVAGGGIYGDCPYSV